MIITIDGPAGSGKSSVAKKLAELLNFEFFDTGAMYRAVTWYLLENKVDVSNEADVGKFPKTFTFDINVLDTSEKSYFVNGKEVTKLIRLHDVTKHVSEVSALKVVRKHVVEIQRNFGRNTNAVFEGRDMGTVVFPFADVKFFLSASPKVRAERRFLELSEKFPELAGTYDFDSILKDIVKRDEFDSNREISPLKRAEDAYFIDTSKLSLIQVTQLLLKKVEKYRKRQNIPRPYFLKMNPFYGFVLFTVRIFFKIFYRLEVHGINNFIKGPAIIASNHTSYYDPPAIAVSALEEVHFLAKESLFRGFFLGKLIRKLNSHPLSSSASDVTSFKKIIKMLIQGKKVMLFPEGARSKDGKIGKIKSGIALFVYLSKCSIIPTYIHGTYDIWGRTRKRPKLFGKVDVVFGTPIYFSSFEGLGKDECMERIVLEIENSLLALETWVRKGMIGSPP